MTWALCLSCGQVKWGAICACPRCQVESTGNMELDITFSDHRIDRETLEELGAVVESIHEASDDRELCFYTFIHYVSVNYPEILAAELKPEARARVEEFLTRLSLPVVTIRPSPRGTRSRKENATGASGQRPKQWWEFWKRS